MQDGFVIYKWKQYFFLKENGEERQEAAEEVNAYNKQSLYTQYI